MFGLVSESDSDKCQTLDTHTFNPKFLCYITFGKFNWLAAFLITQDSSRGYSEY
jgi:hypothetical protein